MDNSNRADAYGIDAFAAELGRANKRGFILNVILILVVILTNLAWTIHFSNYETETVTIEAQQDCDGTFSKALIVGGDYGGTSEGEDN